MQFAYARELAESLAGEKVLDAVVAVPPWFNQFERQAVVDALDIGGLRTVGLINDGPASACSALRAWIPFADGIPHASVAMNYAMTRTFPEKEYHIFYDSGSLSTSATLVALHTYPVTPASALLASTNKKSTFKPKPVNTTHIEVLGVGYDRTLGGHLFDTLIKDGIIAEFETKNLKGRKIEGAEKEKSLAKVAKEATRVKAVLSANTESAVTVRPSPYSHVLACSSPVAS